MKGNLSFFAGERALEIIKDEGLRQERIRIMPGAAGGPKWLVLSGIDRVLARDFFRNRKKALNVIGSSIGSWRFAALCEKKPVQAIERFESRYIRQVFKGKPSPGEISEESRKVLDDFIPRSAVKEILSHPFMRIHIIAVLCRWPVSSDNSLVQGAGLAYSFILNVLGRKNLKHQFERVLFYDPREGAPFIQFNDFPTHYIKLNEENLKAALLASGSIPQVMSGVRDISGSPPGVYRDGGMLDYHLNLPYGSHRDEIIFFPHFSGKIIPGWLDKALPWRKPGRGDTGNLLVVAPSPGFVESLPLKKIPDRGDFALFRGRDADRIECWDNTVKRCREMGDEFMEAVGSGAIRDLVAPLHPVG